MGKDSRCRSILKSVTDLRTKQLGKKHPEIVHVLLAAAKTAYFRKHYDSCMNYCEQAQGTNDKLPEKTPIIQAKILHQKGICEKGMGQKEAAVAHLSQELKILEELYGEKAFALIETIHHLAYLYGEMKRYDESAAAFERCIKLVTDNYNSHHLEVADLSYNLAMIEAKRKNLTHSCELLDKAYAIKKVRLGADNADFISLGKNIVEFLRKHKQDKRADEIQAELEFEEQKDIHVLDDLF